MAQIKDGCFRVLAVNHEDFDLINLHNSPGTVLSVERHHNQYSTGLEEQINRLNPGNCINAKIQSEDVYQVDGIWRILDMDCFEETELHALEVDQLSPEMPLILEAIESGQSSPETIESNGRKIGFKVAKKDPRGKVAHGPPVTTYIECHKTLRTFGEPPYEIISLTDADTPAEVRYYLSKKGTDVADRIIDEGEYLVAQDR